MYRYVSPEDFKRALSAAREVRDHVREATSAPEELPDTGAVYYLADDAMSGYGVTSDGVLIAVFSLVKGRGRELVLDSMMAGASHLDCFDGFLVGFYESLGWREYDREANWTPGGPDVVYMSCARRA